jgi:hypothetical protein
MGGACSTNGDRRGAYRILVGKPEERRRLGRLRRRREEIIEMELQEKGEGHGPDRCDSGRGQMAGSYECGNKLSREFLD